MHPTRPGFSLAGIWISKYPLIITESAVPLFIKDDTVAALVATLATQRGVNKQEAVRLAVSNELARTSETPSFAERLAAWHKAHPLPPPTGKLADKAFFDELSGDV
jgi:antitoxin VapB